MDKTTLYFDELTVGDIMAMMESELCSKKILYLSYGTNLRAAWDALVATPSDYEALYSELGIDTNDAEVTDEMVAAIRPFLTKDINNEHIKNRLETQFSDYLIKDSDKDELDNEFKRFCDALFDSLSNTAKLVGLTLVRRRSKRRKKTK